MKKNAPYDGILFDIHGAMSVENIDDPEGDYIDGGGAGQSVQKGSWAHSPAWEKGWTGSHVHWGNVQMHIQGNHQPENDVLDRSRFYPETISHLL